MSDDSSLEKRIVRLEASLDEVASDLKLLRGYLASDPHGALNKARYVTEGVLHRLCKEHGVTWGKGEPTLENMLGPLVAAGVVPKNVGIHLRTIQSNASPGSHYQETPLTASHVHIALLALVDVLEWRMRERGIAVPAGADDAASISTPPKRKWLPYALAAVGLALAATVTILLLPESKPASTPPPRVVDKPGDATVTAPSPPSDMVRIAGGAIVLGVGDATRFRAWCKAHARDARDCDEFLARIGPPSRNEVATFDLDRLEVNSGDFARWLNDGLAQKTFAVRGAKLVRVADGLDIAQPACDPVTGLKLAGGTVTVADVARAATCMTYTAAVSYCAAQGKRLPTAAEWSLAAGGTAQRVLPWGSDTASCRDAVYGRVEDGPCHELPMGPDHVMIDNADVTPDGVRALAGNVSEWIDSPDEGGKHVARGGSWAGEIIDLHAAKLMRLGNDDRGFAGATTVGFRCARTPKG